MPTKLMQHLHMGPEDAIKAHYDLGCPRLSVGIHWGTFMMSDEHYLAPRQVLEQVWESYSLKQEQAKEEDMRSMTCSSNKNTKFTTTAFGQTVILD